MGGTGQTCDLDSDCATSACNDALNVCQCHQCIGVSEICAGCDVGQACFSPGGTELNSCLDGQTSDENIFSKADPSTPNSRPVQHLSSEYCLTIGMQGAQRRTRLCCLHLGLGRRPF